MDNKDKRADAYDHIIAYENDLHEKNQRRIKIGIRLIIIVPLLFLAVMFKMDSSKVVFLVLWIASLFCIAGYLIVVEYADYKIQHQLREWGLSEADDFKGLIDDRKTVVEKVIINSGKLIEQRIDLEKLQSSGQRRNILQIEQKDDSEYEDESKEYDVAEENELYEEEYDEEEYDEEEYDEEEYDEEEYDEEEYDEEEYDEEEYDEEEYDEEEYDEEYEEEYDEEYDEEEYNDEQNAVDDDKIESIEDEYNEEPEESNVVKFENTEEDYLIDEQREKIVLGKKRKTYKALDMSPKEPEENTVIQEEPVAREKIVIKQRPATKEKAMLQDKPAVKTTSDVAKNNSKKRQGMAYSFNDSEEIDKPTISVTPKNIVVNSPNDYINKRKKKTTHKVIKR